MPFTRSHRAMRAPSRPSRNIFRKRGEPFATRLSTRRPPSTYIVGRAWEHPSAMDSATSTIRQFLIEAHRRLDSRAVAFVSPSLDEFHFHSKAPDAQALNEMLRSTAPTFVEQSHARVTKEGVEPLVRNRVRYENGGPLLGRFLVVPVSGPEGTLAGIVMLFRPMEWLEFSKIDARNAAQLSRQL